MEPNINTLVSVIKAQFLLKTEASGRHIHLSKTDAEYLFGKNYRFSYIKELSQPGQFACTERVTLKTPKGELKNVAILMPFRNRTQVEISMTDAKLLGLNPPVRLSGDIADSPGLTLCVNGKELTIPEGVIVAKRHIHLTPETANRLHVSDNEAVRLKVFGSRPLLFDDTVVRISNEFADRVHLDFDEANACGLHPESCAVIVKKL